MKKTVRVNESELISILQNLIFEDGHHFSNWDSFLKGGKPDEDDSIGSAENSAPEKKLGRPRKKNRKWWIDDSNKNIGTHYRKVTDLLHQMKLYQKLYYETEQKLVDFDIADAYPIVYTKLVYRGVPFYQGTVELPKFLIDFDFENLNLDNLEKIRFMIGPESEFGDYWDDENFGEAEKSKLMEAGKKMFMDNLSRRRHLSCTTCFKGRPPVNVSKK